MANPRVPRPTRDSDYVGQTFGRWTVKAYSHCTLAEGRWWLCQCQCGTERCIMQTRFLHGRSASCGCARVEACRVNAKEFTTHGRSKTTEYKIWAHIIGRCENPTDMAYADYGGRGITICPEWRASFVAFYSYVGPRPSRAYSIDRYPNNNGNYEPGNVRWATRLQQGRNTRGNLILSMAGRSMLLVEWEEETGIPAYLISLRIKRLGWSHEKALTTPVRKTKRLAKCE